MFAGLTHVPDRVRAQRFSLSPWLVVSTIRYRPWGDFMGFYEAKEHALPQSRLSGLLGKRSFLLKCVFGAIIFPIARTHAYS